MGIQKRLIAIGVVVLATGGTGVMPIPLPAQARAETAIPVDSAPTFARLTLRALTLKVQLQTLRATIGEQAPGARGGERAHPPAWRDSVLAIGDGIAALRGDVLRLERAYQHARSDGGTKLATQLGTLVTALAHGVRTLADTGDSRAARTEISHLSAQLDALLQKVAEGEACCRITLHQ
jgi:hypothetical protein